MLRRTGGLTVLIAALGLLACSEDLPPPITISEGIVTVTNQTSQDWKNVLITVNDHFVGAFPELKAEGRANAPLSQFTTGHGQRWQPGTVVRKILVKGTNADGTPVELTWEIGQRR